MKIEMLDNEYWWGGSINAAHDMPYHSKSKGFFDLNGGKENDQFMPILLSSKGRYIWSEKSFSATIENGTITLNGNGEFIIENGHKNLRGAYISAMKSHFKFSGKMPNALFWCAPQYNTWIELKEEQTYSSIINYAEKIIQNGLKPGVLMIDEGWQEEYGLFEFNKRKIPDPKLMIQKLHSLGFKVMLWVTPLVSSAGTNFKKLRDMGYLIKDKNGEIALRKWWNGTSCVLDLTNEEVKDWYNAQLNYLMQCYDVDGFKFDAGDRYFYNDDDLISKPMPARDVTTVFNEIGEGYDFNEYRASWKFGGKGIVARLHDKYHSWNDFGINTLIPHTIMQGLCGYAYGCPDMVGGGSAGCFGDGKKIDEELFVRWTQVNALMGMIQISIAPWRILSNKNLSLVLAAIDEHTKISDMLYELAKNASKTGEPIIRHMAYVFPDEGFEMVNDQFMIGDNILAAPVIEKGATVRKIIFPCGKWKDKNGAIYEGGQTVEIKVTESSIPYFVRQ